MRRSQHGTYGTTVKSMIHSVPEVYLLNGEPYKVGELPLTGPTNLVRLLNACYDERSPCAERVLRDPACRGRAGISVSESGKRDQSSGPENSRRAVGSVSRYRKVLRPAYFWPCTHDSAETLPTRCPMG